jgi:DNA-binding MarR family transcriptional regulator
VSIASNTEPSAFLANYLPYLLHRADSLISQPFHAELTSLGLQMSEWRVLAVLDRRGPSPIGLLTDETMLPQPTVTHAVARLEERCDVTRIRSDHDRRQRIVALTDAGVAKVMTLITRAHEHETAVLDAVSMHDASGELRRLLTELIRRLEASSG